MIPLDCREQGSGGWRRVSGAREIVFGDLVPPRRARAPASQVLLKVKDRFKVHLFTCHHKMISEFFFGPMIVSMLRCCCKKKAREWQLEWPLQCNSEQMEMWQTGYREI